MKKLIALLVLILPVVAFATNEEEKEKDITLEIKSRFLSKYLDMDTGLPFSASPVWQNDVVLKHEPTGIYIGISYDNLLGPKSDEGIGDRIDYIVGWRKNFPLLDADLSVSYEDFGIGRFPDKDFLRTRLKVSAPSIDFGKLLVRPFASYTGFIVKETNSIFEGGNFYTFGIETEIALAKNWRVISSSSISWDDGVFREKPGALFIHSSGLNYSFSSRVTWNVVEATFFVPPGRRGELEEELVFGTGVTVSF